jgi:hypothetical protein
MRTANEELFDQLEKSGGEVILSVILLPDNSLAIGLTRAAKTVMRKNPVFQKRLTDIIVDDIDYLVNAEKDDEVVNLPESATPDA